MAQGPGPPTDDVELFRSANLLVRAVGRGRRDTCVVTFACLLDVPDLAAPGFGEAFLRDRGVDAIHVTCAGNDWYQYPELFAALGAVRSAVRPYRRVLSYGSSMGGYAAVRFGERVGAHEALAISPQFSVDGRRVPFETRWRRAAAAIRFRHEDEAPAVARATVVYDPLNRDARHVALLAAAVPVRPIRLIHAGHPAGAYLAEVGLLADLVLALCAGDPPPDFERRARAARRRSGQYLFSLARRLPRRRADAKLALARRAVAVAPTEPVYRSYLAVLLDGVEAEAAHRAAAGLMPDSPLVLGRLARFLLRAGRGREALDLAEALGRLAVHDRGLAHLRVVARLAEGQVGQALRASRAAGLPATLPALLRDALLCLAWRPAEPGWRSRLLSRRRAHLPLHLGTADERRAADMKPQRSSRPRIGRGRP